MPRQQFKKTKFLYMPRKKLINKIIYYNALRFRKKIISQKQGQNNAHRKKKIKKSENTSRKHYTHKRK